MTYSSKTQIVIEGIVFDDYGFCGNLKAYAKFDKLVSDLDVIGDGLTGGHHGTDQQFRDYKVGGYNVRQVLPGTLERGYLKIMPG